MSSPTAQNETSDHRPSTTTEWELNNTRRPVQPETDATAPAQEPSAIQRYHVGDTNPFTPSRPSAIGVSVVRWFALVVGLVATGLQPDPNSAVPLVWAAVLVFQGAVRTIRPWVRSGRWCYLSAAIEVGLPTGAIVFSGFWTAPWLPLLLAIILSISMRGGRSIGVGGALLTSVLITGVDIRLGGFDSNAAVEAIVSSSLVLLAALAGSQIHQLTTSRVSANPHLARLHDLDIANRLLIDLHRLAQKLPAPLDEQEVHQSTIIRLEQLISADCAAILVLDEANDTWTVKYYSGDISARSYHRQELPSSALVAITNGSVVRHGTPPADQARFLVGSKSAMYMPLKARNTLVGLLVLEANAPNSFTSEQAEALVGFAQPVGLAIDNARWFNRIRTMSADQERTRIARNLHDSVGQSLAYLGFELDRMQRNYDNGQPISEAIGELRSDVKKTVTQVRETLYNLRSDVAETKDLVTTVEEFAARLARRSHLKLTVDSNTEERLPLSQEREMWRIAQEALINVERHADASEVKVFWTCTAKEAVIEVIDNGKGLTPGPNGRVDSYGITGMRERAHSLSASLELISTPHKGTMVRCSLNRK